MVPVQQQKAAKEFAERWQGKGYEKGESQKYRLSKSWIDELISYRFLKIR